MPFEDSGFQIDRDDAFTEKVVSRTVAAVIVAGWRLHGKVRHAELFIGRNLRPDTGVSVDEDRIALPRVVTVLT